jgi:hypothetical protein
VADPQRPSKIFCWKLTETTDAFANRIEYAYLRDRDSDGAREWDQLYLEKVRYIDYEQSGRSRFLVSVTFADIDSGKHTPLEGSGQAHPCISLNVVTV